MHGAIRGRYVLLYAWTGLWMWHAPGSGRDWVWFDLAGNMLFGRDPNVDWFPDLPTGLHTLSLPYLHLGPLSIFAALAIRILPGDAQQTAAVGTCLAGPLLVLVAERAAVRFRGLRAVADEPLLAWTTLIGGGAFLVAWVNASWFWDHLDDVLTVACAALAVWAIVSRRPVLTGVGVGLAIAAKFTGVFFIPLLFCLGRKQAVRTVVPAALITGIAWLPFVVAAPSTLRTADTIAFDRASPLRLLGLDGEHVPGWVRPVQVALGVALGLVAVARGRWPAAIVVATGARLALDPATFGYYNAPLLFGALVWDLLGPRRPLPLVTLTTAAAFLVVPDVVEPGRFEGGVRLIVPAVLALVLLAPLRNARWPRTAHAAVPPTPT